LKLAGISTIEAANRWLSETYMAAHNKQFAIDADQEGSAFGGVNSGNFAQGGDAIDKQAKHRRRIRISTSD
jgi:hypothetical protein